jgi:hypothetical protein
VESSPWDRVLGGEVLGDSADIGLGEAPMGFGSGAALAKESTIMSRSREL